MQKEKLTLEQAKRQLQRVVKMPITRAWKGYGTFVFLEMGNLQPEYYNSQKGIRTFLIGDWSLELEGEWKIKQKDNTIIDTKNAGLRDIKRATKRLVGLHIEKFNFNTEQNSISIVLNHDIHIQVKQASYGFLSLAYNHRKWLIFDKERIRYESRCTDVDHTIILSCTGIPTV
jgi:hypothetical protein